MKNPRGILILGILLLGGLLLPEIPEASATSWSTKQISNIADDCFFNELGQWMADYKTCMITAGEEDSYTFLRWRSVAVNASALKTAILSVYSPGSYSGSAEVTVYGIDEGSTAVFDSDTIHRPYTSASVNWNVTTWGSGWKNVTITAVIKEILSRGDWSTGNNLGVRIVYAGTANNTGIYKYIATRERSTSQGAKLYLETYAGDKPYNGGWDFGELINSTVIGDMWEVWNGSEVSYMIHASASGIGTWNSSTYTEGRIGNSGYTAQNQAHPQHAFARIEPYIYTVSINSTDSKCWLRRSADEGKTWTKLIDTGIGNIGMVHVLGDDQYIHLVAYISSISSNYRIYNTTSGAMVTGHGIGTITDGSYPPGVMAVYLYPETGTTHATHGHIKVLAMHTTDEIDIYEKDSLDDLTWSSTNIGHNAVYANINNRISAGWYEAGATHWYIGTWSTSGSEYSTFGYYVDGDLSISAHEHLIPDVANYKGADQGWINVNNSTGTLAYAYYNYNSGAQARKIWVATRSAGVGGSWSAFTQLHVGTATTGIPVIPVWDFKKNPDDWSVSWFDSGETYAEIYSDSGSLVDNSHYHPPGYSASVGFIIQTLGGESTHYYQFHYVNCTWLPPTPTPVYPEEPTTPEDPDPPGWEGWDTGMFSRFRMRIYFFIVGLGCIAIPVIAIVMRRVSASTAIMLGWVIIIGFALLWSIPGI